MAFLVKWKSYVHEYSFWALYNKFASEDPTLKPYWRAIDSEHPLPKKKLRRKADRQTQYQEKSRKTICRHSLSAEADLL